MLTAAELRKYEIDPIGQPIPVVPQGIDDDGLLDVLGKSLISGFLNVGGGLVGTAKWAWEALPLTDEAEWLGGIKQSIDLTEQQYETTPSNAAEWVGKVLGQAFPYMGSALASGAAFGTIGAGMVGFAVEGQEAYDSAKARGVDEKTANRERALVGLINASIEMMQIGSMMEFSKTGKTSLKAFRETVRKKALRAALREHGGKLTAAVLRNSLEESVEEMLQEGVQFGVPWMFEGDQALPLRNDGSVDHFAMMEQVAAAGLAGAVAAPFLGGAKAALEAYSAPTTKAQAELRRAVLTQKDKTPEAKGNLLHQQTDVEGWTVPYVTEKELTEESDTTAQVRYRHSKARVKVPEFMEESVTEMVEEGSDITPVGFFKFKYPKLSSIVKDIRVVSQKVIDTAGFSGMGGCYLGSEDIILISENLSSEEQAEMIGHELRHAYNMKHRSGEIDKRDWKKTLDMMPDEADYHDWSQSLSEEEYEKIPLEISPMATGDAAKRKYRQHIQEREKESKIKLLRRELHALSIGKDKLTREQYHEQLREWFGKSSATELSLEELNEARRRFAEQFGELKEPLSPGRPKKRKVTRKVQKKVGETQFTEHRYREGDEIVGRVRVDRDGKLVSLEVSSPENASVVLQQLPASVTMSEVTDPGVRQALIDSGWSEKNGTFSRPKQPLTPKAEKIRMNRWFDVLRKFDRVMGTWAKIAKGKRTRFRVDPTIDTFSPDEVKHVLRTIEEVYDPGTKKFKRAMTAWNDLLFSGKLPKPKDIEILRPVLGHKFADNLRRIVDGLEKKNLPTRTRVWHSMQEAWNLSKAMLASVDFSGAGRQGFFGLFAGPRAWGRGVMAGYRAFFDPAFADYIKVMIRTHEGYDLAKSSGVDETEIGTITRSEEFFASRWANRIPGVRASERAYVTTLNLLRFQLFYNITEDWKGSAKLAERVGPNDYKVLAQIVNHLTGRGNIKSLRKLMPFLNMTFFSPQNNMSHFQKISDLFPIKEGIHNWSPARKMLAYTLVKAFGTSAILLYLLSLMEGVSVEADPRSTDFGKVRIGDTRIDFLAGYSQIMRVVAGIATGERKTTTEGTIIDQNRWAIAARFLQTKLSPPAGAFVDLARGETFRGKTLDLDNPQMVARQVYERFTPLFLQDVGDAVYFQGLNATSVLGSGLALHGVNVMTYPENASTRLGRIKDHYSEQVFGVPWQELGPTFQAHLKRNFPAILQYEEKVAQENLYRPARSRFINDIRKSERELYEAFGYDDQQELKRLLVNIGGLSRRIGGDWYLNDERYDRYKREVREALLEHVPNWLSLRGSDALKKRYIEKMIDRIKATARRRLVFNAKMEDLQRIRG